MIKLEDYKYFLPTEINLPDSWETIVLEMCENIDREIRPWYISKTLLNAIKENYDVGLPMHNFLLSVLAYYTCDCQITQIKNKFATLQVRGTFSDNCQEIVNYYRNKCNITCEVCGNESDTSHANVKGWIKNLCPECITKKNQKNDSNITNNPSI